MDIFCLFGQCFYLVTLHNTCLLQLQGDTSVPMRTPILSCKNHESLSVVSRIATQVIQSRCCEVALKLPRWRTIPIRFLASFFTPSLNTSRARLKAPAPRSTMKQLKEARKGSGSPVRSRWPRKLSGPLRLREFNRGRGRG